MNIIKFIKSNKVLVSNFGYLSILNLFNLIIPLITLPYLIRVLGNSNYGLTVYAQSVISFFQIFVSFGFNISATKDVSLHRDNPEKLSQIVSSVFLIKFALFLVSLILLTVILSFLPQVSGNKILFYLTMYMCLDDILIPQWYFLGIEKMKFITFINVATKCLFLVLTFILIKNQMDYVMVPVLRGMGTLIAGVISIYLLFIIDKIKFKLQHYKILKEYLVESFPFFVSRTAAIINIRANAVIIGAFLGLNEVAYYDVANKISEIGKTPINILNQVAFPNAIKHKNMNSILKIIKVTFLIGIVIFIAIFFLNDYMLFFLGGKNMLPASSIVILMCITIPIASISYHMGNCVLIAVGDNKHYNNSIIWGSIIYFVLIMIFFIFHSITLFSLTITIVATELFILLYRMYFGKKYLITKR